MVKIDNHFNFLIESFFSINYDNLLQYLPFPNWILTFRDSRLNLDIGRGTQACQQSTFKCTFKCTFRPSESEKSLKQKLHCLFFLFS